MKERKKNTSQTLKADKQTKQRKPNNTIRETNTMKKTKQRNKNNNKIK